MTWRLLRTAPAPGPWNMAVDDALAESARDGGPPTLRFYGWNPPCLSLGRNQPAKGFYPADLLRFLGVDILRRRTGGRAVLHDRELTYSVVANLRDLPGPRDTYSLINRVLADALVSLGVPAGSVKVASSSSPVPSTNPCFGEPSPGEIMLGDRKLVGSAQVKLGHVLLQHGSILIGRSPVLDALPPEEAAKLEGTPAYVESLLGSQAQPGNLIGRIIDQWTETVGRAEGGEMTDREVTRAQAWLEHYRDPAWTWSR